MLPAIGYAQPYAGLMQTPATPTRILVEHRDAAGVADRVRSLVGGERSRGLFVSPSTNEIILQGSDVDRNLIAEVIAKLDQPPQSLAGPPVLRSYRPAPGRAVAARQWAEGFTDGAGQRAAWDERTGQLIVFAPEGVHAEVSMLLQPTNSRPALASASRASDAGDSSPTAQEADGVRLLRLSPLEVHDRLEALVGRPLPATWDSGQRWLSFPVGLGSGPTVDLRIDARDNLVVFEGEAASSAAWGRVIAALDAGQSSGRATTRLVATSRSRQPAIRKALRALQQEEPDPQARLLDRQGFVAAQPETSAAGRDAAAADEQPTPEEPAAEDDSLLGPVQVEFVEGLDIIVLRGNDEDVARVQRIINQIEQLSAVTAPAIVVQPLKHVASAPMAQLLVRIYQQVLGPRTGSVSITPLGKPNSLLLIGREENVQRAVELAERLDQPVGATSRFEVFPLRHAVATDAKELIDDYLEAGDDEDEETAPALAPSARVIADYRSNTLIVSAAPREIEEIRAIVAKIDVAQSAAVNEVRIFPLRNSIASDLAQVLRDAIDQSEGETAGEGQSGPRSASLRFLTVDSEAQRRLESGIVTSVRIAADERANSLVVSAPADSMELIAALIAQLDRSPDAEAEIKVFTIANGDAVALVEMLRSLFNTEEDDETGGVGASSSSLVKLQFSVDERTNSIIAAGATEDLDVVYAILTRLDGADTRERLNRVFRLNNAYAVNVAETLTDWLDSRSEAEQEAELTISPFEQIDREVIIVADESSNSLIISATPDYYRQLEGLIRQLDERPPMVMMQVLIAEVRLNDTDEFGIELGLQDSLLFDRSLVGDLTTLTTTTQTQSPGGSVVNVTEQSIINSPLTPGFNFNNPSVDLGNNGSTSALADAASVAAQGLVNFGVGRVSSAAGFGGFVLSASSSSIDMLLRALQENRRLEVLSRPQITMLDGQAGRISVGQSVQRIAGVSFDQLGRQTNQLEEQDVGIILEVTPRISPEGQVVMQVGATRSELGQEEDGTPVFVGEGGVVIRSPPINQTIAETTVMAASGQTIVLGGLLTKSSFDVHRQVPVLADIPLLGDLFRFDSVQEERTELLIIMTPRVIRSEQDAEMIKQVESARMSWVMCDVVNLHGPSGLRNRCDEWGDGDCEVVYPDHVPVEGDFVPTTPEATPELMHPGPWSPAPGTLPPAPVGALTPSVTVEPAAYFGPVSTGGGGLPPNSADSPPISRLPPVR